MAVDAARTLVIACGALAREIVALRAANGWTGLEVRCLPPELHNRPERIPEAVREAIAAARNDYEHIFVAYADCGTGGRLDALLEAEGIERLPGAHCYELFATGPVFASLADAEPGTFYLTDFLVRHFERLVVAGLGLERHPELAQDYFRHYRRVVYLAQTDDAALAQAARAIAARLGLDYCERRTGYGELESQLQAWLEPLPPARAASREAPPTPRPLLRERSREAPPTPRPLLRERSREARVRVRRPPWPT